MYMIVLVEGPDGSGKTTLIDGLMPRLKAPRLKLNFSYPNEPTVEENVAYARGEYESIIRNLFNPLSSRYSIVCDRFHLGEFVYGPIMRQYSDSMATETLRRIEWWLIKGLEEPEKVKLILLTCNDPRELLYRSSGDSYVNMLEEFISIRKRYDEAFNMSILSKIRINTQENNKQEVLTKAVKFLGIETE